MTDSIIKARSTLRVSVLVGVMVVVVGACGGSSDKPSSTTGSTTTRSGISIGAQSDTACRFLDQADVTTLFGTRPEQTSDPYGIGGTASNCLWRTIAGGKQYLLQVGIFDGGQHYAQSVKDNAKYLTGLGDKAFISDGTLSGVTIEFVRANKTYFILFSIAKTTGATVNDANAQADQLLALVKHNLSRL